ncbi:MAG: GNAT family N-acetyltransferase, partial [Clostridia bacterium]|nr:GNAT family N-acetyltransferase [Clostridia bacterium]
MWEEGMNLGFCAWRDTFCVCQMIGEQPAFTWPYGPHAAEMVDELLACAREKDLPLRFFAVNDETLELIRADGRFRTVSAAFERRWSDYIYSFEDAAAFRGKKFSGQRNHVKKFRKLYGEPQARALGPEDMPLVEAMLEAYEAEHQDGGALERLELARTRAVLTQCGELGLLAAGLFVEGQVAAISVGEVTGDMLLIHVEKALRRYEGAYPAMYQGLVKLVWETLGHPLRLVNREDDSGDPGLRTSKQQYQPIGMVNKYLAHIDSPAARLMPVPVLRQGGAVLTPFREDDRAAYLRLNTDVENNRYWGYDYREDENLPHPIDENTFYDSALYDMQAGDSVNFASRLSEAGEMIGEAILWNFTINGAAEIGCRLFPEWQGRGLGRAAFGAAADLAQRLGLTPR